MGLTYLNVDIGNPTNPDETRTIKFLIDSGAIYSVVPRSILEELGIRSIKREVFRLADGGTISRDKGIAFFRYGDRVGGADVIFGEEGDMALLGVLTLESLGYGLNPLKRELMPLPMVLA
jgi:clan AA aspartic protease